MSGFVMNTKPFNDEIQQPRFIQGRPRLDLIRESTEYPLIGRSAIDSSS